MCCGRCRVAALAEGSRPVELTLELEDFDAAAKHEPFRELIAAAPKRAG